MDSVLIDAWLGGLDRIPILDEASIALARERVRELGASLGLPAVAIGRMVNIASELGHNHLAHARDGAIAVVPVERAGVAGLEVFAADRGDGIRRPDEAMAGAARSLVPKIPGSDESLGVGVSAVVELADEVDFDVRVEEGTCVRARVFGNVVPRRREVGIYGRPYPGEHVNGDHAAFVRLDDALLLGVADGLGHGPYALDASRRATDIVRQHATAPLERIFDRCDAGLTETRGAVMALARLPEPGDRVEAACAGNVSVHVAGPGVAETFSGPPHVLGTPVDRRRTTQRDLSIHARDVIMLFTDGLTTRASLAGELDLLREHPIFIAYQLFHRFGRDNDDVLVLVAK